jgi:hypothetical protein
VEGVVTDFRHRCKVVIALAAVKQCFSLEVDLRDIDVLKKTVAGTEYFGERGVVVART